MRLDEKTNRQEHVINGIAHIGLSVKDINCSVEEYCSIGFVPYGESVTNEADGIGPVAISMLSLGEILLEIYQYKSAIEYLSLKNQPWGAMLILSDFDNKPLCLDSTETIYIKKTI